MIEKIVRLLNQYALWEPEYQLQKADQWYAQFKNIQITISKTQNHYLVKAEGSLYARSKSTTGDFELAKLLAKELTTQVLERQILETLE